MGSQTAAVIKSYADHELHTRIGGIIRESSENKKDIRSVLCAAIPWETTKRVLDLGCGYGWFEDVIPGGRELIVGIDYLRENGGPFLKKAMARSREAEFYMLMLPADTGLPDKSFDLVLSLYSLYFFPGVLPEVSRLLDDGALFVALTHSHSMLEEGRHYFDFRNLRKVIERFSAENGEALLREHFREVEHIDYVNTLVFREGDEKKLAMYIDFKKEFIEKDVDPTLVREKMVTELRRKGELRLNKNDRIFLARK